MKRMTIVVQSMIPDETDDGRRERAEWTEIVSRDDETDAWDRAWQIVDEAGLERSRARKIRTTETYVWFLRIYP